MFKIKSWPLAVIIRYTLLQIPEILLLILILYGLYEWFSVALWMLETIFGIWIAKDIIMFFFVWKAYQIPGVEKDQHLQGETGVVIETLEPHGYVKIRGEMWKAKSRSGLTIRAQQEVYIVDQKGLLLIVDPVQIE